MIWLHFEGQRSRSHQVVKWRRHPRRPWVVKAHLLEFTVCLFRAEMATAAAIYWTIFFLVWSSTRTTLRD